MSIRVTLPIWLCFLLYVYALRVLLLEPLQLNQLIAQHGAMKIAAAC
jgi:ABC-type spermidine/putrescine transport system permease subunit I